MESEGAPPPGLSEESAMTSGQTHARMVSLLGKDSMLVSIPEAGHHVGADQPIALVAALRALMAPALMAPYR